MTKEAGLCCGLSSAMASRPAPGRHDVSCTLVVKLSSATRLSLPAGQPKLTRASLLSQVPGTTVRRPLAMDTSSSCTACPPSSASLLRLTSTARNLPSGLKAAVATDLPCGSSAVTCRPVARFSTSTRQRAAHDGAQAIWVALAAITALKVRLARGAAGFHYRSAIAPGRGATGASNRPRSVACSIR
jgi:hypothetical protein